LRQFIIRETQLQQIIDFGDAPVFAAIAYPTIVITQKGKPSSPNPFSLGEKGSKTNPVPVPLSPGRGARGEGHFHALNWQAGQPLSQFETLVKSQSFAMPQQALTAEGWQFADTTALNLLEKLRQAGTPLGEYVNNRFYYGIKTGFNEAFVVDKATRDRLIAEHPSSAEVLKPFLRGRDVKRWTVDYSDLYLIKIESSENKPHPWTGKSETKAEQVFAQTYPAIYNYFSQFREALIKRCDQGKFFWELRSCIYWQEFERSKIIYPNICERNNFAWDETSFYANQKTFIIPSGSKYLLGVLNSSIMMWIFIQTLAKLQNGFYEPSKIFMEKVPIPPATDEEKKAIETLVSYVLYLTEQLKDQSNSSMDKLMNRYFEQIIDALVLELYLPEELHAHQLYFSSLLHTEDLPLIKSIQGDKIAILRDIFKKLYAQDHPIRHNLFLLDTVKTVRIIGGKTV
jgi:hypothetical protein